MSEYDPRNRQIDQEGPDGLILRNFRGPVEIYEKPNSKYYVVYMYVYPDERLYFNVHRKPEEAEELFRCACEVMSHLPENHSLNGYLYPHQPQPTRS